MTETDWKSLAPDVERALRATRDLVLDAYAREWPDVEMKADRTVVTALDHALEEPVAAALAALDSHFGLVGEEGGVLRAGSPTWHLDPLDGTFNFTRRVPLFATQVALLDGSKPLFSAVYEPLADDFSWAARGAGAWRQGKRLHVSTRHADEALLYVDVARNGALVREPVTVSRLRRKVYRVRALGTVALQMRDVASGTADGFFGSRRHPSALHDLGPGLLLVREAGGMVTNIRGGDPFEDRRSLLAANPVVHPELLSIVDDTRRSNFDD